MDKAKVVDSRVRVVQAVLAVRREPVVANQRVRLNQLELVVVQCHQVHSIVRVGVAGNSFLFLPPCRGKEC